MRPRSLIVAAVAASTAAVLFSPLSNSANAATKRTKKAPTTKAKRTATPKTEIIGYRLTGTGNYTTASGGMTGDIDIDGVAVTAYGHRDAQRNFILDRIEGTGSVRIGNDVTSGDCRVHADFNESLTALKSTKGIDFPGDPDAAGDVLAPLTPAVVIPQLGAPVEVPKNNIGVSLANTTSILPGQARRARTSGVIRPAITLGFFT